MKAAATKLIYTAGAGRLGNQVIRFAHWIAWALENSRAVEVRDLAFWPYAEYFATWRAHPGCVFPLRADGWDEIARWLRLLPAPLRHRLDLRVQRQVQARGHPRAGWQAVALDDAARELLDLADPAWARRLEGHAVTTCAGWRFASWEMLGRQEAAVRQYFQPAPRYAAAAGEYLGALRQRHGFIIGVHVRQGDYRTWEDGRFYFPIDQYEQWIGQALTLHADRNPVVVVVSDEPLAGTFGAGRPVQVRREREAFADWTVLSLCDVILCPPSTFPATAAFAGARPLWPVVRPDQVLDRAQVIADGLLGAARHPEFSLAVK